MREIFPKECLNTLSFCKLLSKCEVKWIEGIRQRLIAALEEIVHQRKEEQQYVDPILTIMAEKSVNPFVKLYDEFKGCVMLNKHQTEIRRKIDESMYESMQLVANIIIQVIEESRIETSKLCLEFKHEFAKCKDKVFKPILSYYMLPSIARDIVEDLKNALIAQPSQFSDENFIERIIRSHDYPIGSLIGEIMDKFSTPAESVSLAIGIIRNIYSDENIISPMEGLVEEINDTGSIIGSDSNASQQSGPSNQSQDLDSIFQFSAETISTISPDDDETLLNNSGTSTLNSKSCDSMDENMMSVSENVQRSDSHTSDSNQSQNGQYRSVNNTPSPYPPHQWHQAYYPDNNIPNQYLNGQCGSRSHIAHGADGSISSSFSTNPFNAHMQIYPVDYSQGQFDFINQACFDPLLQNPHLFGWHLPFSQHGNIAQNWTNMGTHSHQGHNLNSELVPNRDIAEHSDIKAAITFTNLINLVIISDLHKEIDCDEKGVVYDEKICFSALENAVYNILNDVKNYGKELNPKNDETLQIMIDNIEKVLLGIYKKPYDDSEDVEIILNEVKSDLSEKGCFDCIVDLQYFVTWIKMRSV